jgi:hypothetical protein
MEANKQNVGILAGSLLAHSLSHCISRWVARAPLAPTESWSDRSQNCLHDMGIVGDT